MELVGSAGGVVWHPGGGTLALVHRPRRSDWSLPKGKLDAGERWHRAALREVAEETGSRARILAFAGAKLFLERETPKLVLYWHMQALREGLPLHAEEIDEVAWLPPREALQRLDHASDRRLLLRALSGWAWREPVPRRAGPAPELRSLVLTDRPCTPAELDRWLRLVEDAVAGERTGARRSSSGEGPRSRHERPRANTGLRPLTS